MLQTPQVTNKNRILDLVAWMRKHDPNERYDWCSGYSCLIAQYSQHIGLPCRVNEYPDLCGGEENYYRIARGPGEYLWGDAGAWKDGWTFGQAVQRAEELLAA